MTQYAKINDPDKGVIPFEDWPHLVEILDFIALHKELVILKARQLGVSWLLAGYALWKATFFISSRVLMLSQGETEAADLLNKSRFIHSQLPDFLRLSTGRDQSSLVTFPTQHSEIRALPSTERAGHGYNASLVVRDELEHHPCAELNFAAVGPSIDAGGQMIDLSTVNKMKQDTHFKTRYIRAKNGDNGAIPMFLPWDRRPGRTADWFEIIKKKYSSWQVEQEYPCTEQEALSTLQSVQHLENDALDDIHARQIQPLDKHDLYGKHKTVKIYKLPVSAGRYMAVCDPSDGKEDPHAIIVVDAMTMEEVASSHGKVTADRCAVIYDDLVRFYNNAFNVYELNARAGGMFSTKLKDLETPNQCDFLKTDKKLDYKKTGWWTGDNLKEWFYDLLEEAVRDRAIQPHSPEAIKEMRNLVLLEGESMPEVPKGGHDDWCDVWARVVALKRYVKFGGVSIKSYTYTG